MWWHYKQTKKFLKLKKNIFFKNENTLQHAPVSIVGNGENMRWNFMSLLSFVIFNDSFSVNRQFFVRVHYHTKQPGISLQKLIQNTI